jgi:hypothetical protein
MIWTPARQRRGEERRAFGRVRAGQGRGQCGASAISFSPVADFKRLL